MPLQSQSLLCSPRHLLCQLRHVVIRFALQQSQPLPRQLNRQRQVPHRLQQRLRRFQLRFPHRARVRRKQVHCLIFAQRVQIVHRGVQRQTHCRITRRPQDGRAARNRPSHHLCRLQPFPPHVIHNHQQPPLLLPARLQPPTHVARQILKIQAFQVVAAIAPPCQENRASLAVAQSKIPPKHTSQIILPQLLGELARDSCLPNTRHAL